MSKYARDHQWVDYSARVTLPKDDEFSAVDILAYFTVTENYPEAHLPVPFHHATEFVFKQTLNKMKQAGRVMVNRTIALSPIVMDRWVLGTLYEDLVIAAENKAAKSKSKVKKDAFDIIREAVASATGTKDLATLTVLDAIRVNISATAIIKRNEMLRTQLTCSINTLYQALVHVRGK